MEPVKQEKQPAIDCFQCVHFAVSWDPKFPRSCRLLGFKSVSLPSVLVYESTGLPCVGFEKKERPEPGIKPPPD